jgi:hypothetical protein
MNRNQETECEPLHGCLKGNERLIFTTKQDVESDWDCTVAAWHVYELADYNDVHDNDFGIWVIHGHHGVAHLCCIHLLHVGDLLRLAYSKHIISPIMFMLMNTRTLCTTNSINLGLNCTMDYKSSYTSGCLGTKYILEELKMPICLAHFTSFLATHLWSLSILVKTNFPFPVELSLSCLSIFGSYAHLSSSNTFFFSPSIFLSFYLFVCSLVILSAFALFTQTLIMLSNAPEWRKLECKGY